MKSEIQAKFELHPSEYILQISGKWTTITRDGCSLADYNIHKNSTLDIKFLHPNTEPIVDNNSLRGGADDSAEEDNTYKKDDEDDAGLLILISYWHVLCVVISINRN